MLFRQHVETTIDQQGRRRHLKSRRPSASSFENQNFINSKEQRRRNSNYLTTSRANNSRLAAINQFESIDSTISKQQQQVSSMQATLCNERLRPDYQPDEVQPDNMTTTTRARSINASQHKHLVRHSKSCLLINNIKMSPNLTAAKMVLYSLTVGLLLLNSIPQDNQVLGHRNAPNNSTTTTRHDHLHPIETERHFQLLRSANVELNRRSLQRPQREAGTGADQAGSAPAPTCGYPGSPAHASVTFNTTHVVAGTAASYACDNGYELLGPPRRICHGNGTWSPVGIPFCVLNVGLGKAAMQSSTAGHGSAQKAVDGSTSPYYQASTCTMTDVESNPWWYVNLLEPYLVQIVRIDFGTACCANRQKATIAVRVGNNRPDLGNNPLCNRYHGFIEEGKPLFLPCTRPAPGAFVSIHLEAPSGSSLSICETFIYTDHALSIEQCPSFRDQPLGSTATYNGKCYLFHNNQALSFDSARKYCESRGGTLVDETSPALQGFLSWELYRRHRNDQLMGQYWLGAVRDTRNQQNWKWINGKDVQISFWNSLGSQGNCSRFDGSKGWLWSDTDCQANLNFICQYRPLSCGKPEKPTNSTLITKNVDNGTVIEYQCAPGNLLMGPKSRACLPTGFFSEFAPKCKYLDCQFPAGIDNGSYKLLNRTTSYLSVVNYFCQEGYQMLGKPTLTCDVDERWNGPPPRCEPLLCPAPVAPSNGFVTVTSNMTIAGTQATYDCRPGYELVGDRLLTCQQSGSWDNSFPYCREKRQIFPHTLHGSPLVPGQPSGTPTVSVTPSSSSSSSSSSLSSTARPPVASTSARPKPQVGAVQFPSAGASSSGFSSNRLPGPTPTSGATSTASPPTTSTTTTTTTTSLPTASLNGLAGQFVSSGSGQSSQQQQPSSLAVTPGANEIIPLVAPQPANQNEEPQQQRKPAQSSSVSQFVLPELSMAPMRTPVPSSSSSSSSPSSPSQSSPSPAWPPPRQSIGPQQPQQQPPLSPLPQPNQAANNRQSNQKFSFNSQSPSVVMSTTGSQLGYDSSPLATTNSISVHPTSTSASNQQPGNLLSTMQPPQTTTTINHQHHQHSTGAGNVLASFSPTPVRSHNTLANAKYSLDGIIAVAIFGGFIFLGAIITILVIIIRRRKSSQSSTIDAQTISTYDSNGEHNGLYRNYQQAWENLRFAGPNGQPKSSGNGAGGAGGGGSGVSLITAHVSGGPSVGLKNYASPAALLQHPGAPGLHHQLHGHHNMAMSSASSSQSNSSLGGGGAPGSGGGDPLLGHQHLGSHMHHQHSMSHHHHHNHHLDDEDEDEDDVHRIHEDDEDEQGVISADEANYLPSANRPGHHHAHHAHHHHLSVINQSGEGFRDSNELTINADTALMSNMSDVNTNNQLQSTGSSGNLAARRRLYSTNSIGRSMASVVANRRSMGNMSGSAGQHHVHPTSATGGGQHQRLVSSSTSSTSTHSSRASPPSTDDHSLDRLAYGNNWQATSTGAEAASTTGNKQQAGGSGIARANLRYS